MILYINSLGVTVAIATGRPALALQPYIDQIHEIYATNVAAFNELVGENGQRVLLKKAEEADPAEE